MSVHGLSKSEYLSGFVVCNDDTRLERKGIDYDQMW